MRSNQANGKSEDFKTFAHYVWKAKWDSYVWNRQFWFLGFFRNLILPRIGVKRFTSINSTHSLFATTNPDRHMPSISTWIIKILLKLSVNPKHETSLLFSQRLFRPKSRKRCREWIRLTVYCYSRFGDFFYDAIWGHTPLALVSSPFQKWRVGNLRAGCSVKLLLRCNVEIRFYLLTMGMHFSKEKSTVRSTLIEIRKLGDETHQKISRSQRISPLLRNSASEMMWQISTNTRLMEREIRRGQGGKSGQRTAEEGNLWSTERNSEKEEDREDEREKLGPAEREREKGVPRVTQISFTTNRLIHTFWGSDLW